jgi:glycosyltransferase involved in cell wall biosynthesis
LLFSCNQSRFFATHRLPLAEAARRAGYDVHIAVPLDSPGTDALREAGFPLHHLPIARSGVNPVGELRVVAAFTRLYQRLRPDVVHHVTMKPVLYGSLAARLVGVPAVVNAVTGLGYAYTGGSLRARTTRVAVRTLWRGAFGHPRLRAIFQNTEDRDEFVAAGVVRGEQVVMTRGSGVDLAHFRPAERSPDVPTVLLAARLLWLKGVGEFVEAARRLRARGVPARFVIVGDTDDNPTAIPEAQLRDWAAEGAVEWWGRRDDMPDVLRSATVFCLPTYYREGIPKAVLEAAATGLAIVTTDVRGVREAVGHEEDGLLVPPRDAGALADALARVLGDDALRVRLGRAARARAEREFGVDAVVAATLAAYADLRAARR